MRWLKLLGYLVVMGVGGVEEVKAGCGNHITAGPGGAGNSTPLVAPGSDPTTPGLLKGDPVVPYTGNEYKEIDDLRVWGAAGTDEVVWRRYANSRQVGGSGVFGMGHYWRHFYQWELSVGGVDEQGRATMVLVYPDGATGTFSLIAPMTWAAQGVLTDELLADGSDFMLKRKNGYQYHFARSVVGGQTVYLMTDYLDDTDCQYTLQYNVNGQVSKVSEPAGRSFTVSYTSLSGNVASPSLLAQVTSVPVSGQWKQWNLTDTNAYRYVRLVEADGSYGHIAGVEFYEAGTGVKLGGAVISSDNVGVASNALDGNTNTEWVSGAQSGGFVGYDLGTARRIGKVRFLCTPGSEALQKPTTGFANPVRIEGANFAMVSTQAISQVSTSDGRSVQYNYSAYNDPSLPYRFPVLSSVSYSDGSTASYGYGQIFPGMRPLVTGWNDVRCKYPMNRYQTVYQSLLSDTVVGMVDSQVNSEGGGEILKIGISGGLMHHPTATYANGMTDYQVFDVANGQGNLSVEYNSLGHSTNYTYYSNGYTATMTDDLGGVTSYVWTEQGNPLVKTYPDGGVEKWTRNALDSVMSHTDRLGNTTSYTRDGSNRVTGVGYPDGSSESFSYNALGKVLTHGLRSGGSESFSYDGRGLLLQKTDAMGNATLYGYDSADRLAVVTDAKGNTTTSRYNERGEVIGTTYADGSSTSRSYSADGDLLSETDQMGQTRSYGYDIFHHLTNSTDPLGGNTRMSYQLNCLPEKPLTVTTPSGRVSTMVYDREWNMTSKTVGSGGADAATWSYTYDSQNNLLTQKDPLGQTTTYGYDAMNRRVRMSDPLGNVTQWGYDPEGEVVSVTRPDGGITSNVYDTMRHLVRVSDAMGNLTSMSYDRSGNMTGCVDAKGNSYSYSYDLLSRRLSMSYPDGSRELWSYDPVGNMATYTTRAGQTASYSYDSRNRCTGYSWSDGTPAVSRTYDAAGRLLTLVNSASAVSFSYDADNRLLSETQTPSGGTARTSSYSYDGDGNRTTLQYPDGSSTGYLYNGRGLVTGVTTNGTTLASYSYNGNNTLLSKSLNNGMNTSYTYDGASRLRGMSCTVVSYGYTLDALGRRTSRAETISGNKLRDYYTYDADSQLTNVAYATGTNVNYAYDAVGNRTSVNTNASGTNRVIPYLVNNCNQYTQVGSLLVSSDRNGNLTSDQNGNTYSYDAQNRLISARSGTNTLSMTYDAQNRVVSRTVNGVKSTFVYAGWKMIAEYSATGSQLARYEQGPGSDEPLARTTPTSSIYYTQDGNGNVTAITSSAGAVQERYTYDVYGTPTIKNASGTVLSSSGVGNRFLFTGREYIAQIGLYDYRNRVYSPGLGRFLQTDPIRFQAGDNNIYRYCGNNPISGADPMGLCGGTFQPAYIPSGGQVNNVLGGDFSQNQPSTGEGNESGNQPSGVSSFGFTVSYTSNNINYTSSIGIAMGNDGIAGYATGQTGLAGGIGLTLGVTISNTQGATNTSDLVGVSTYVNVAAGMDGGMIDYNRSIGTGGNGQSTITQSFTVGAGGGASVGYGKGQTIIFP